MAYDQPHDQSPEQQDELPLGVPPEGLQHNWAPPYEALIYNGPHLPILPNSNPNQIFSPVFSTVQPWVFPIDPALGAESPHGYADMGMSQPEASHLPHVKFWPRILGKLKCLLCGGRHRRRNTLYRHLWAKHKGYAAANNVPSKCEDCPFCNKHHYRSDALKDHILKHH